MELKLIRTKEGVALPSNPEDSKSIVRMVQKGMIALVPSTYNLDESKYDLIQKVNTNKKK